MQTALSLHFQFLTSFQLTDAPTGLAMPASALNKQPVALGELHGPSSGGNVAAGNSSTPDGPMSDEDALQARLDALRRG